VAAPSPAPNLEVASLREEIASLEARILSLEESARTRVPGDD